MSYIPNTDTDREIMLDAIGVGSIDDFFAPIPAALRFTGELDIPTRMDQITLMRHATASRVKTSVRKTGRAFLAQVFTTITCRRQWGRSLGVPSFTHRTRPISRKSVRESAKHF